jgi:uncharacterized repeat protein (TIGR03803 family)
VDNILYGTTRGSADGAVFQVTTDSTLFGDLYVFSGSDGAFPDGPLSFSTDPLFATVTLYGTTRSGGLGLGTLFSLGTDGRFTTLVNFTGANDGATPSGVLLWSNTLFGTTRLGGLLGRGVVYSLNTDGTEFTVLHNFGGVTNTDGSYSNPGLVLSGNSLYGTASSGGASGQGTVFKINIDGTGFGVLHTFTATTAGNGEGSTPNGELVLSGAALYGTTQIGGFSGQGTVFRVNIDGSGFATLYNFTGGIDGAIPNGGLVISNNVLYGTTHGGGGLGYGTVFSLSFSPPVPIQPPLAIKRSQSSVILGWPTSLYGFSFAGYFLEATADLASPAVWNPVSPLPVVINGRYTVTNPISGPQQFFRLRQ